MRSLLGFLAVFGLVLAGCTPPNQGSEFEDEKNPFFRSAAKYASEQNYYAAVAEYEKALNANPNVARAHFEMGLLYGEKLGDHVSAIYHLQKYQSARPNAPNQEQVKTLIEKSKVDFLLTLPNSGMQNADEVARISRENADLKQTLAKTQAELSQTQKLLAQAQAQAAEQAAVASAPPSSQPATAPENPAAPGSAPGEHSQPETAAAAPQPAPSASAPAPEPAAPRTYTVKPGDSLWRISSSFYPKDIKGGIEKIKEANPILGKGSALKPGQILTIP